MSDRPSGEREAAASGRVGRASVGWAGAGTADGRRRKDPLGRVERWPREGLSGKWAPRTCPHFALPSSEAQPVRGALHIAWQRRPARAPWATLRHRPRPARSAFGGLPPKGKVLHSASATNFRPTNRIGWRWPMAHCKRTVNSIPVCCAATAAAVIVVVVVVVVARFCLAPPQPLPALASVALVPQVRHCRQRKQQTERRALGELANERTQIAAEGRLSLADPPFISPLSPADDYSNHFNYNYCRRYCHYDKSNSTTTAPRTGRQSRQVIISSLVMCICSQVQRQN